MTTRTTRATTTLSILLMCGALLLAGCEADDGGKAARPEATPMETQAPNTTAAADPAPAPTAVAAGASKPAPTLLDADVPSQLETATFALG